MSEDNTHYSLKIGGDLPESKVKTFIDLLHKLQPEFKKRATLKILENDGEEFFAEDVKIGYGDWSISHHDGHLYVMCDNYWTSITDEYAPDFYNLRTFCEKNSLFFNSYHKNGKETPFLTDYSKGFISTDEEFNPQIETSEVLKMVKVIRETSFKEAGKVTDPDAVSPEKYLYCCNLKKESTIQEAILKSFEGLIPQQYPIPPFRIIKNK